MTWEWEAEQWMDVDPTDLERAGDSSQDAPEMVTEVPRLASDIHALTTLTSGSLPARAHARASNTITATYLMGDASGRGFGSAVWGTDGVLWESGHYGKNILKSRPTIGKHPT